MVYVMIARLPLPLHLTLAQDETSVSFGQSRLGVPEIRAVVSLTMAGAEKKRFGVRWCTLHADTLFGQSCCGDMGQHR